MSVTTRNFGEVVGNPVSLEGEVTFPVCEGLNMTLASFHVLDLQYQKHCCVVEGAVSRSLHGFFSESCEEVRKHIRDLSKRLSILGGIPAATFLKLENLRCVDLEPDGAYDCRTMIEHDLKVEQSLISIIRRGATQAESMGDRATRCMYEKILEETEYRAFRLARFLKSTTL